MLAQPSPRCTRRASSCVLWPWPNPYLQLKTLLSTLQDPEGEPFPDVGPAITALNEAGIMVDFVSMISTLTKPLNLRMGRSSSFHPYAWQIDSNAAFDSVAALCAAQHSACTPLRGGVLAWVAAALSHAVRIVLNECFAVVAGLHCTAAAYQVIS